MNDTDKKMLTEWMGECWHEYPKGGPSICIKCDDFKAGGNNRTFTTWQDVGDLKDRLEAEGLWDAFSYCTLLKWEEGTPASPKEIRKQFIAWLFRPTNEKGEPHFCGLVAEFKPWEKETVI